MLRIGSLFSGAGGLDVAIEHLTGGQTVFHAEIDTAASLVLAEHWPSVPNLGDVSTVDWTEVLDSGLGVIDILCLGFPCQDVSAAGLRKGMAEGTRSGLWTQAVRCISVLRPESVCVENVQGLLSIDAGDGRKGIDVVIADLEALDYGVKWCVISAASIGAPHQRKRVFILAQLGMPSGSQIFAPAIDPHALLPTPKAMDGVKNIDSAVERARHDPSLAAISHYFPEITEAARRLMPIPQARDGHGESTYTDNPNHGNLSNIRRLISWPDWGDYAPAIEMWKAISEAEPPCPVEPNTTGGVRLACEFSEWMMGWPAGWVTALMNKNPRKRIAGRLGYTAAMKVIGNGVVAHQAVAAFELLGLHTTLDIPVHVG